MVDPANCADSCSPFVSMSLNSDNLGLYGDKIFLLVSGEDLGRDLAHVFVGVADQLELLAIRRLPRSTISIKAMRKYTGTSSWRNWQRDP